ncbi:HNH endonuclease signature motif containing protein [Streptomyces sp. NBC_00237]|uniref:HNH endonuclease n=1 Tax=Streptomyces sp. NBC_00237 TaxID=2975687 RepID=UPI00338E98CA
MAQASDQYPPGPPRPPGGDSVPRAASICYRPGCVGRTVRQGLCGIHAPAERPWARTSPRNRDKISHPVWQRRIRPQALNRDGYACAACGSREELEVDHIIPIAKGGTWELENAQTLCKTCHKEKTLKDRQRP